MMSATSQGELSPGKTSWLRSLYNKVLESADSPKAFWIYLTIAFAESSVFLLPPDLMMIPMGVANRKIVWRLAFWGTVASVLGGLLGYAIGSYLMETVGQWVVQTYKLEESTRVFHDSYAKWGFWIIVLKGITPVPYKLVTIASGMAHYPLGSFIIASFIARAMRFYLLAALLWNFGDLAKSLLDRYLGLCLAASLGIIVAGFILVKWISG